MAQYKPGLHKDVKTIFEGVWDPELDNTQQFDGLNSPPVSTTSRLIREPVIEHSKFKAHSNVLEKECKRFLLMPSRKKRKRNKLLSILRY
jgi:hypothetical protein